MASAAVILGEPPLCDSMEGAGLRVTELACEMRWLKLGNESAAAAATLGLKRGQAWGDNGMAGDVGVIRCDLGLFGGNPWA
jgi:hypothetical protein